MSLAPILQAPSASGVRLITQFEGFEANAYPDPIAGWRVPTIGYGTTVYADGRAVRRGDVISQERAMEELRQFLLVRVHPKLAQIPDVGKMTEPMIGALESFAYNLGEDFYGSDGFDTITRKLRDKDWVTMRGAFLLYVNPGSSVEAGLRRRRMAEASLWESGLHVSAPPPSGPFDAKKFADFFRYYNPNNPNHRKAVEQLAALLPPGALSNEAEWVKTYRTPPAVPAEGGGKLPVPYFSQRDSHVPGEAMRMCFSACDAMLLNFLKPGLLPTHAGDLAEDDFLARVLRYGDTTDAGAQVKALESFGLKARFSTTLNWADVDAQLKKGIPVPIGILHHGPVNAPSGGGHWILVIGKVADGSGYYVNDPFGDLDLVNGGYPGSVDGAGLVYSVKNLTPRWLVEGDRTGYGILAEP